MDDTYGSGGTPGVLSASEFECLVEGALESSESTESFLALYLIDLTDGARSCVDVTEHVLAASEAGEAIGSGGRGALAVLRPSLAIPADAIARCERLLDVVRPKEQGTAEGRPSVSIGLALHPARDAGVPALFDTARRGLRAAMRDERDGWAVG